MDSKDLLVEKQAGALTWLSRFAINRALRSKNSPLSSYYVDMAHRGLESGFNQTGRVIAPVSGAFLTGVAGPAGGLLDHYVGMGIGQKLRGAYDKAKNRHPLLGAALDRIGDPKLEHITAVLNPAVHKLNEHGIPISKNNYRRFRRFVLQNTKDPLVSAVVNTSGARDKLKEITADREFRSLQSLSSPLLRNITTALVHGPSGSNLASKVDRFMGSNEPVKHQGKYGLLGEAALGGIHGMLSSGSITGGLLEAVGHATATLPEAVAAHAAEQGRVGGLTAMKARMVGKFADPQPGARGFLSRLASRLHAVYEPSVDEFNRVGDDLHKITRLTDAANRGVGKLSTRIQRAVGNPLANIASSVRQHGSYRNIARGLIEDIKPDLQGATSKLKAAITPKSNTTQTVSENLMPPRIDNFVNFMESGAPKEAMSRWRTPENLGKIVDRSGVLNHNDMLSQQPSLLERTLSRLVGVKTPKKTLNRADALHLASQHLKGYDTNTLPGVKKKIEALPVERNDPSTRALADIEKGKRPDVIFRGHTRTDPLQSGYSATYAHGTQIPTAAEPYGLELGGGHRLISTFKPLPDQQHYPDFGIESKFVRLANKILPYNRSIRNEYQDKVNRGTVTPQDHQVYFHNQEYETPITNKNELLGTYAMHPTQGSRLLPASRDWKQMLGSLTEPIPIKSAVDHNTPAVHVNRRDGKQCLCPHCSEELTADNTYTDAKGWKFHRPCFRKGKGSIKTALATPLRLALGTALGGATGAGTMALRGASPALGAALGAVPGLASSWLYDFANPNVNHDDLTKIEDHTWERQKELRRKLRTITRGLENRGTFAKTYHHRVAIPKNYLQEQDLKDMGYLPSMVAVPEAGQDQWTTYRHPYNLHHFHSHPDVWTVHKDEFPSIAMLKYRDIPSIERLKHLGSGIRHATMEGVPGYFAYIRNAIARKLSSGGVEGKSPMVSAVLAENPKAIAGQKYMSAETKAEIRQHFKALSEQEETKIADFGGGGDAAAQGQSATTPPLPTEGDGSASTGGEDAAGMVDLHDPEKLDTDVFDLSAIKKAVLFDGMSDGTEDNQIANDDTGVEYSRRARRYSTDWRQHFMNLTQTPPYQESSAAGAQGKTLAPTGAGEPQSSQTPAMSGQDDGTGTHMQLDSSTMNFGPTRHMNA